jgi:hypothetical protein
MKTRILTWSAFVVAMVGPKLGLAQTMPPDDKSTQTSPAETTPITEAVPGTETPVLDPTAVPDDRSYNYQVPEYRPTGRVKPSYVKTPGGMAAQAGGGVAGFFNDNLRDVTDTGANYGARLTYGTRMPVGLEAAYIGSAQSMKGLGLDRDALLFSNGAEAMVRVNLLPGAWQPFVAAGAAWRHWAVRSDVNTSNVKDNDDTFEIPANLGVAYRARGFLVDLRAIYRGSFSNDLLGSANMSTWNAAANLGIEF